MCTLEERFRRVLQRKKDSAVPCLCGLPLAGPKRYRDIHQGRVVTVVSEDRRKVSFCYDDDVYDKPCELSSERFHKKFKQVEV